MHYDSVGRMYCLCECPKDNRITISPGYRRSPIPHYRSPFTGPKAGGGLRWWVAAS